MSYRLSFKNNSLTLSNLSPLEPLTGCRRRSADGETVGRSRTGSDAAQDAAEGAQRVGAGCGWAVPYLYIETAQRAAQAAGKERLNRIG